MGCGYSSTSPVTPKKEESQLNVQNVQKRKSQIAKDGIKYKFKYVLVGESGVGKTSLLHQFTNKTFIDGTTTTLGVDYASRKINIDGNTIQLTMWDTAGQERFHTVVQTYFRGAVAAILAYDITDRRSWDAVPRWLNDLKKENEKMAIALVGTKVDAADRRKVKKEEAAEFARQNGLIFLETSAKDNVQVVEVFIQTAEVVYELAEKGEIIIPN